MSEGPIADIVEKAQAGIASSNRLGQFMRNWGGRMRLWSKATITTMALAVVLASACEVVPAFSQASSERQIENFACKDVMREPSTSREVAIAFLHGYLLGKSGTSKFDVDLLKTQTDSFIDQCLDHPAEKAVDVMIRLKAGK